MKNEHAKPTKSSGTCWIDHKLWAIKSFIDKRGLYLLHVQNVIADETKNNDKATLEGKRSRITQGSLLLKCTMYVDILEPARQFSLITQKTTDVNIVKQVSPVNTTLAKYKIMSEKVNKDATSAASSLPTVQHVLSVIEQEGSSQYQGVDVLKFTQSKDLLPDLVKDNLTLYVNALENVMVAWLKMMKLHEVKKQDKQMRLLIQLQNS